MNAGEHRPWPKQTILIVAVVVVVGLIAMSFFLFSPSSSNCDALSCDSLVVRFTMTATRASNGSVLFAGVITNDGRPCHRDENPGQRNRFWRELDDHFHTRIPFPRCAPGIWGLGHLPGQSRGWSCPCLACGLSVFQVPSRGETAH